MAVFTNDGTTFTGFDDGTPIVASGNVLEILSGEIHMNIANTGGNYVETGFRVNESGNNIRRFGFKIRLATTSSLSGDHNLLHCWADSYGSDFFQLKLGTSDGGTYHLLFQDLADNTQRHDSKRLSKGTTYAIEIRVSDKGFALYIDGEFRMMWQGRNASDKKMGVVHVGEFYSDSFYGDMYFDDVWADVAVTLPTAPSTESAKIADVWDGYKTRYIKSNGMVVRPAGEGSGGTSDVVSEGQAYGLLFSAWMNDKTTFDAVEEFTYDNILRKNHPTDTNISTHGANLMGWLYRDYSMSMEDWNFATDADVDRICALFYAHARWGSSGTINYLQRALDAGADLKAWGFETDGTMRVMVSDVTQLGSSTPQFNPSYVNPVTFYMLKQYTGDTFWDSVMANQYTLLEKSADNAGGIPTTKGLFPNWAKWDKATDDVIASGITGGDNFTYDAFRTLYRLYWAYLYYKDTTAKALLAGNLATFISDEWTRQSKWSMEYGHDGTPLEGGYEKSMGTYGAYFARKAVDSDTLASTIKTAKLEGLFEQSVLFGSFYQDAPSSHACSYFNDSWMLFGRMTENGEAINIGESNLLAGQWQATMQ